MTSAAVAPERPAPPAWFVLTVAASTGAAVMVFEMSAVRALQPFFGSSTFVWANVIAVVLGALALGYAAGGRLADARPEPSLLFGFTAAGGVLAAVAAGAAGPVARLFLESGVDVEGMPRLLARGSLGTSLAVFALPVVAMGAVPPFAVRILASAGAGRAAGRVLAASTAASVAGTYLATFLLVPAVGSRGAMLVAAALAALPATAGLVVLGRTRSRIAAAAVVAAAVLVAALGEFRPIRAAPPFRNGGVATVLAERESPYQYLTVREDRFKDGEVDRVLTINEGTYIYHSLRIDGHVLTDSRHYDDYTVIPALLDVPPGGEMRIGVVGFAAGVNAGQFRHFWRGPFRLRVEGAEIDGEVVRLGREFFDLAAAEADVASVTVDDGRRWLGALPPGRTFHVLVVDAFANEIYMPFHLATTEFLELCRSRLEPGGILAMNIYAVGADSPNLAAIEQTLATAFGACVRSSRYGGYGYLLLARKGDDPPDLARLSHAWMRRRFGERTGVAEWEDLLDLASEVRADTVLVRPRAGARILTDDDAPLEYLTDRFVGSLETHLLGETTDIGDGAAEGGELAGRRSEASGRRDELRALTERQHRLLWWIAGAWCALAAAGFLAVRRATK